MKKIKRFLSVFLTVLMALSILPIGNMEIEANATSKTVDEAMAWCEGLINQKVGSGQCVALIQAYYQYLGVSAVSGNGCDYATNSLPSGWTRVKGGEPQAGDILVYTGAWYGHVAIYAGGSVSYHQNMAGKYVEKKTNWAYYKSWVSDAEGGGTKSYWGYIRPDFGGSSGGGASFTTDINNAPSDWQTFDKAKVSSFNVAGWAFRNTNELTRVYYCFDNNGYTQMNPVNRQDVLNVYGNTQLDCGFNQNIDISGLSVGDHTFKIWCSSNGIDHVMYYIGITISDSNTTTSPNGIEYRNQSVEDITTKDARIKMWISNPTGKTIWSTGFWFGTDPNNLSLYVVHEKINWTDFCADYVISNYYGELSPGITYYYRHYVVEEENFYYTQSAIYSFTTYGLSNVRFGHVETTAKSSFDANISAWAWNNVGYTISSCGFYLGESPITMKKYQIYSNIAWTDFNIQAAVANYAGTLTPGKTYYYRFYAVIDTNYYSDIYSFTTDINTTITFNPAGGVAGGTTGDTTFNLEYGKGYYNDVSGLCPSKTGYTFLGWFTGDIAGDMVYDANGIAINDGIHWRDGLSIFPYNYAVYAHWACTHSSTEVRNAKSATCTATGYTGDTYCKTCGTKTKTGSSIAATGHTWTAATCTAAKTCSVCKATDGAALGHSYTSKVTKAATCTASGVKTFTCSKCSNSYTETIPATGHTWTAATCTAAKTCSVCKATDGTALGHSFTSKVTKAATCTAAGVKTFTCSKCSNSYTENIPATGHTWTAATCTAAKTCSVCKATDGAALGHSYTSKVTKAATCTAAGVKTFTCSKCSHSYTESIPATGHTWTAATCTAAKTCSVCKATDGTALGHSYTSKVTKAATCTAAGVKTFTCSKCSHSYTETIPATGHSWTAATCTAAKTCSVCKATEGAALGHSYTSKVTKAATCTADGVKTFTCSKCSHSYTEPIPATGHTWTAATCTAAKTCSVCKATEGAALGHSYTSTVTKAATCTTDGVKTFTCSKCSHSYTESIPATGHTWTAATCTAAKTCSVCKATEGSALGHSYTSAVTKAATCTAAGVKTFTCSKCSNSYTEAIAATGHKWTAATCTAAKTCSVCKATDGTALGHNYTSTVTKAATCTAAGVKTFTCSKCSHSYTESIPATGHTWTAATCTAAKTCSVCKATEGAAFGHSYTSKVTKAATCTAAGVKTFTCSKCSHSYTEPIPATGHTWTAATCTAAKTCSVCKATDGTALGHNYTSTVTKAATCTAAGVKTFTCSVCKDSYTETIAALGHTPGLAATCTTDQTCTVCGEVLTEKLGHDYNAVVTAPTCTTDGYTTYTCTACGDSYVADTVSATGHSYNGVATTAPTCTAVGVKTFTCADCGDVYTEEMSALGHTEETLSAVAATCTETGLTEGKQCSVCGEILVEQAEIPANGHVDEDANGFCDHCSAMMPGAELLGDVDGDGQITSSDARSALRAAVGLDSLSEKQKIAADVNKDGAVTSTDARSILRCAVGLETF